MDRQGLLKRYRKDKLILSKVLDKYLLCEKSFMTCFTPFIDPGNLDAIAEILPSEMSGSVLMLAYGGADECERKMIGFFPDYPDSSPQTFFEDFPIDCLKVAYSGKFKPLSHRDFLGTLISLGIDRSKLGDIFVYEKYAYIFVNRDISDFICSSMTKIGNTGITVDLVQDSHIDVYQRPGEYKTVYVSSPRLDGVISAAFNVSRGTASDYIDRGKTFVNWASVMKSSYLLKERDVVSLRGYGRFIIQEITKNKDRFALTIMINQ